uniref:ankyrin repeat domain-containing protein 26-like n=1 Tax=Monopterus albus TaxID=43700 RepID=UPI0009B43025|nr:ankyrin repeat domain-containing protein 26-like [Monopterus albus]
MDQLKMNIKRIKNKKKQELQRESEIFLKERLGLYDKMEELKKHTQAKEEECQHLFKEKLGLYNENEALKAELQAHKKYREEMSMLHKQRSDKLLIMSKDRAMDNMQQETESVTNKVQEPTNNSGVLSIPQAELQCANILLQLRFDLLSNNCKLQQEMDQLKMNIKFSKNKEKRELQYENYFLHKQRVGLYDIIEEFKKLAQAKEEECQHLIKEKQDLYNKVVALKTEMQAHQKYKKQMDQLKKNIKRSGNKEKQELQHENDFFHKERVGLYDTVEDLKKLAQVKEEECQHLFKEKLGLYNENEALKAELQAHEKYMEEMSMLHNQRSKELLIMSKDRAMDNMQQGTESVTNKVQELTNSLKDVQHTTVDLQHANILLQQDNEKLQTELRRLENETESMREEIKTLNDELHQARDSHKTAVMSDTGAQYKQ